MIDYKSNQQLPQPANDFLTSLMLAAAIQTKKIQQDHDHAQQRLALLMTVVGDCLTKLYNVRPNDTENLKVAFSVYLYTILSI
jgi:hypothetical protein